VASDRAAYLRRNDEPGYRPRNHGCPSHMGCRKAPLDHPPRGGRTGTVYTNSIRKTVQSFRPAGTKEVPASTAVRVH
jgi:hypothetical protein